MRDQVLAALIEEGVFLSPEAVDFVLGQSDPLDFVRKPVEVMPQMPLVITIQDIRDAYCLTSTRGSCPPTPSPPPVRRGEVKVLKDITGNSTCEGNIIDFARYFNDRFQTIKRILVWRREQVGCVPSSLIYFDLNGLKPVNDTYGHPAGDAVSPTSRACWCSTCAIPMSSAASAATSSVGVLLASTDEDGAREKATTLAAAVAAHPVDWNGVPIPTSVSWGVHTFRSGDKASEALDAAAQAIVAADRAMYAQKKVRTE